MWQKLLEDNIKPRRQADGTLPLDEALQKALERYEVSFCLLPLQTKKEPKKKEKKEKKDETEVIKKIKGDKVKPGKGKGKGRIPEAIMKLGGVSKNPSGENLCFAYNIGGCKDAADGAKLSPRPSCLCEMLRSALHSASREPLTIH